MNQTIKNISVQMSKTRHNIDIQRLCAVNMYMYMYKLLFYLGNDAIIHS